LENQSKINQEISIGEEQYEHNCEE